MDGLIAYALSKKYADEVGRSILDAGFKTQVEQDRSILQTTGQEKILYFIPKTTAKPSDGYDEYVYSNNAWEQVGATDVDLNYELLSNKPQINGVTLSGNQTGAALGLADSLTAGRNISINNNVINFVPHATNGIQSRLSYDGQTQKEYYGLSINPELVLNKIYSATKEFTDGSNVYDYFEYPSRIQPAYDSGLIPVNEQGLLVRLFWNSGSSKRTMWRQFISFESNRIFVVTDYYNNGVETRGTWEEIGGSQIVSGVVNQNGTISFYGTDSNPLFTTTGANLITSGNQQISMGYDSGGFYFLFDDGQEVVNNGTD